MVKLPRQIAIVLGIAMLATSAEPDRGAADESCLAEEYEDEYDHERARHALECGEVMPLADVLAAVRPHISGKIIETEFEREHGVWIYELTIIDSSGRLEELHVDAKTARILNSEEEKE
jgi:uncharacterized membrane protein YkoI